MTSGPVVWGIGIAAILAFALAFHFSRLPARARQALATAREALALMGASELSDAEKERLIQRSALHLFTHFALITLSAIAVLAVPALVMLLGEVAGAAPFAAVSDFLISWQVIAGATLIMVAGSWLMRRR